MAVLMEGAEPRQEEVEAIREAPVHVFDLEVGPNAVGSCFVRDSGVDETDI
jgi:hypothetical protein